MVNIISDTKITTLLRKFYLNMSKVHTPLRCCVPPDLRSGIIYIWTRYPKINCTGSNRRAAASIPAKDLQLHLLQLLLVCLINVNTFPQFHSIISIHTILQLYVNKLSFHCPVCEIVVAGDNP